MKPRSRNAPSGDNFPSIRGFEHFPRGQLLRQKVDFDGPVGIAYERCIGYTKPEHSHDRITITFPRGSSRSFIRVFPEAKNFPLNEGVFHIMAKDHLHEQGSESSVYDTFALFVTEAHIKQHLEKMGFTGGETKAFLQLTQSFPRSGILHELIERYFVCRVMRPVSSAFELSLLEDLILTEVAAFTKKDSNLIGATDQSRRLEAMEMETALARALEYIESHLFEKLDVATLVRFSRASQATLFRLFQGELHMAPLEYVRNRRLDEAQSLLKTGSYQVRDVALLVGYEDLGAFSKAYKHRFQSAPSTAIPTKNPSA